MPSGRQDWKEGEVIRSVPDGQAELFAAEKHLLGVWRIGNVLTPGDATRIFIVDQVLRTGTAATSRSVAPRQHQHVASPPQPWKGVSTGGSNF
ncbi:MAG: hypothetical protein WEB58_00850, partial [Planctomycetaceae bacterium]